MNEVIEQAAVAVATVLDRPVWALGERDLVAGLQSLEDVVTLARSAQASMLHEFAARDSGLRGATSVATFVRDRLRVSVQAGQRMVVLGQLLDRRAAMSRGSRPPAVAAVIAAHFAVSRAPDAATLQSQTPESQTPESEASVSEASASEACVAEAPGFVAGGPEACGPEPAREAATYSEPADPAAR